MEQEERNQKMNSDRTLIIIRRRTEQRLGKMTNNNNNNNSSNQMVSITNYTTLTPIKNNNTNETTVPKSYSSSLLDDDSNNTNNVTILFNQFSKRLHSIPRFGHTTSIAHYFISLPITITTTTTTLTTTTSNTQQQQVDCSSNNNNPITTVTNDNFRNRQRIITTAGNTNVTTTSSSFITNNKTVCNNTSESLPDQYKLFTIRNNALLQNQHLQYFAQKDDYINGIQSFCMFFCTLYCVWIIILLVLKLYYGINKVGCAAGGGPVDVRKMKKQYKCKKYQRKNRIQRNWNIQICFLFINCCIPIVSFCLYQFGINTFLNTLFNNNSSSSSASNNSNIAKIDKTASSSPIASTSITSSSLSSKTTITTTPHLIDDIESITYRSIEVLHDIQQQMFYQKELFESNIFFQIQHELWNESYFCPTATTISNGENSNVISNVNVNDKIKPKGRNLIEQQQQDDNRHNSDANIDAFDTSTQRTPNETLMTKDDLLLYLPRIQFSIKKELLRLMTVVTNDTSTSTSSYTSTNITTLYTSAIDNMQEIIPYLYQMTAVTKTIDTVLDKIHTHDWILKLFIIVLNICTLFNIGGVLLTRNNINWYAYQLVCQYCIIPLFTIATIGIIIISCIVAYISVMNADFCTGTNNNVYMNNSTIHFPPVTTFLEMSEIQGISSTSLLQQALVYYGSSCLIGNPLSFLDEIRMQTNIAQSNIDDFYRPLLSITGNSTLLSTVAKECGSNGILAIKAAGDSIQQLLDSIDNTAGSLRAIIELSDCSNVSPLFRRLSSGPICTTSVKGLEWIFSCLLVLSVLCLIVITLRAGLYNMILRGRKHKHREKEWEDYKTFMARFYDVSTWKIDPSIPTPTNPFLMPQLLSNENETDDDDEENRTTGNVVMDGITNDDNNCTNSIAEQSKMSQISHSCMSPSNTVDALHIAEQLSYDDTESTSSLKSNSGDDYQPPSKNPSYAPSMSAASQASTLSTKTHVAQKNYPQYTITGNKIPANSLAINNEDLVTPKHQTIQQIMETTNDGNDTDSSYDSTYSSDSDEEALMVGSMTSSVASAFVRRVLHSRAKRGRIDFASITSSSTATRNNKVKNKNSVPYRAHRGGSAHGSDSITSREVRKHLNAESPYDSSSISNSIYQESNTRFGFNTDDESKSCYSAASFSVCDASNFEISDSMSFDSTSPIMTPQIRNRKDSNNHYNNSISYDPLNLGQQQQQHNTKSSYVPNARIVRIVDPLNLGKQQHPQRKGALPKNSLVHSAYDDDNESNTGILRLYKKESNQQPYSLGQLKVDNKQLETTPGLRTISKDGSLGQYIEQHQTQHGTTHPDFLSSTGTRSSLSSSRRSISSAGAALRQQVLQTTSAVVTRSAIANIGGSTYTDHNKSNKPDPPAPSKSMKSLSRTKHK